MNIVDSSSDTEGGNSDDDEQEDDLPELYTHKKLQLEFDRLRSMKRTLFYSPFQTCTSAGHFLLCGKYMLCAVQGIL